MEHKEHFHGSDLEKIEKIYGIKKEELVSFSANVNPLGLSPLVKKELSQNLDCLTAYPDREYSDLRKAFGSNNKAYYLHYMSTGYKEKRVATGVKTVKNPITVYNGVDYSRVYNFTYYTNKYSDIKRIYGNDDIGALKHFVTCGMKEGRQASAEFNVAHYKARYADLRRNLGNDNVKYYMHYISNGYKEHRDAR